MVWYSCFFKNFPQYRVIHTVKGFSIVNEAEVDAFLEFPCFFYDSENIDNLTFGSSVFSKSSSCIWKFLFHRLLKPHVEGLQSLMAVWQEIFNFSDLSLLIRNLSNIWGAFHGQTLSHGAGRLVPV